MEEKDLQKQQEYTLQYLGRKGRKFTILRPAV